MLLLDGEGPGIIEEGVVTLSDDRHDDILDALDRILISDPAGGGVVGHPDSQA